MKLALGLIETKGLANAIAVSDTMLKAANVELIGIEKARGFGMMTVEVEGDIGAVKAAVDAGKDKAYQNASLVSCLVIPRPADDLEKVLSKDKTEKSLDNPTQNEEDPETNEIIKNESAQEEQTDVESKTDSEIISDTENQEVETQKNETSTDFQKDSKKKKQKKNESNK